MAKRELIDRTQIEWFGCNFEGGKTCMKHHGDCSSCPHAECSTNQIRSFPAITEEEIVKPYLEKLKEQISKSCYKALITDDGNIKESKVLQIIDNLLNEKGAEE